MFWSFARQGGTNTEETAARPGTGGRSLGRSPILSPGATCAPAVRSLEDRLDAISSKERIDKEPKPGKVEGLPRAGWD
ncbi:hypothetical protein GCM10009809_31110 [Isoptericola hypogeus]|uniref:Uncharacterized protein n=1 Tax=Isoptericola hypogeus TaxID=300179 RepID=A0ABP4VP13_9MICO